MRNLKRTAAALLVLAIAATPAPAFAWGARTHELISGLAVDGLSSDVPRFLKSKTARAQIALLGREPDRWRGSGRTHSAERDSAHYVDIHDDGKIGTIYTLDTLPLARWEYDKAINAAGAKYPGYLPYAMIDGWQQVVKDFAYWRASTIASKNAKTRADREWFKAEAKLREMLLIRDIGVWSHYVADAAQPQHVSEHSNGWDAYPDPMTYPPPGMPKEIYGVHALYDGPFTRDTLTEAAVKAAMPPYRDCDCGIEKRVPAFIAATWSQVTRLYEFVAAGALRDRTPEAVAFTTARAAAGAAEIRDGIEDAWKASATATVGYPNISVADVISGKVILTREMYGSD